MPRSPAPSPQPHIILASNSPRRRELLREAGYDFTVMPPDEDVECGVCSTSGPAGLVAELAYRKATAVWEQLRDNPEQKIPPSLSIILGADTVAECDGFILGKPRDEEDARAMLMRLSGREHRVLTGVCLLARNFRQKTSFHSSQLDKSEPKACLLRVAVTKLRMDALTDQQFTAYLESGQWEGKAGAFGYQDGLDWVHVTEGSESNVVGLPMELFAEMLREIAASGEEHAASRNCQDDV